MTADQKDYSSLPRLRAQLNTLKNAGHGPTAANVAAEINELTVAAKQDARELLRQREAAKVRYQKLVRRIQELQGSVAEVPSGREGRQEKIRELTAQAKQVKARHQALNTQIVTFKWYLSGVESGSGAPQKNVVADKAHPVKTVGETPRRWWLIPTIVGGILIILAAGLLATSLMLNHRIAASLESSLAEFIAEQGLEEVVRYEDLAVSTLRGSVTIMNLEVSDPFTGDGVAAGALTLRVPHRDALRARAALAVGDTQQLLALSRAEVTITAVEVLGMEDLLEPLREAGWNGDPGDLTRLDEFHKMLAHDTANREVMVSDYRLRAPLFAQSGSARAVYAGDPAGNETWIREIEFRLQSDLSAIPNAFTITAADPGDSMSLDIPAVSITLEGATGFADEWMDFDLDRTRATVIVAVGPASITLPPSLVEELSWYVDGIDAFISDVGLDRLSLDAALREGGDVELRELALDAPIAKVTISGRLSIADLDALALETFSLACDVERLPDDLREPLSEFASLLGASVPASGPFSFSLSMMSQVSPSWKSTDSIAVGTAGKSEIATMVSLLLTSPCRTDRLMTCEPR